MADGESKAEGESKGERLNRELKELNDELRVALPGVQVLFAFLLAVPFQQRFAQVSDFQSTLYFVTLLFSMAASALFIAPTAYHRIMFRQRDKPRLVRLASHMMIAGLVALGCAMNCAVVLVTDVIFQERTVVVTAVLAGSLFLWLWFGMALVRRVGGERSH
jgi:predicted membrane channel-forming protein YqfA (hemolysin III family)